MSAFIVRLQKGAPKVSGPINLALDPSKQAAQIMPWTWTWTWTMSLDIVSRASVPGFFSFLLFVLRKTLLVLL